MFEERIGTKTEAGRVYPALTITGTQYERVACTTCSLDGVHFVVLPIGYKEQDSGLILEVRLWLLEGQDDEEVSDDEAD